MLRTFRSGWARALDALVPIVLAALLLWLPERLRHPEPVTTHLPSPLPASKLWVVLVDSLAARDVDAGTMPKLAARLTREGVHGPVRACADAVTVPCLLAMVRGSDHLSVFALERNFGGGERALDRSILGELARRGVRLGYFGEPQLARPLRGFHLLETTPRPARAQLAHAASQSAGLDLWIAHLLELDDASHLHGGASALYRAVLAQVDDALDALLDARPAHTHVAILGDHGHTLDGRHAAGLDATTYAAYFGPRFPTPRRVSLAITDHAAIWARIFGGRRSDEPPRVSALFGAAQRQPADALPAVTTDPGPPAWYGLLSLACAPLIAFGLADLRGVRRLPARALGGCALVLALSFAFVSAWPLLRSRELAWLAPLFVVSLALGRLVRAYLEPSAERWLTGLAGALVFAPPVLALAGGPRFALAYVIVVVLAVAARRMRRVFAQRAPSTRSAARVLTAAAGSAALLVSLFPGALAPDVPERFVVHARLAEALGPLLPAALLLTGVVLAARGGVRARALGASVLGMAIASALPLLPARVGMVPCALALPLAMLALRRAALFPLVCLVAPAALWVFFERDAERVSPLLALLPLAAAAPSELRNATPLARGAFVLLLVWASYWTTLGARIGGVDFDFYFGFLPADASATSEWPATAALTAAKYLFASALPLLFASQRAPLPVGAFELAAALGRLRLAFVLVLAAILAATRIFPSSWLLGELSQEAALFALLLLTLGLLGVCLPATEAAARA